MAGPEWVPGSRNNPDNPNLIASEIPGCWINPDLPAKRSAEELKRDVDSYAKQMGGGEAVTKWLYELYKIKV